MPQKLDWHIGKEGSIKSRLDTPPYRAFFVWSESGVVKNTADYSIEELVQEIKSLQAVGADAMTHVAALDTLRRANGSTA